VPQRYAEALDVLLQALTSDRVDFAGEHFASGTRIVMRPLQRPHPPLWYGIANPDSTVWAAAHDVNVVSLMPLAGAAKCLSPLSRGWAKLGKAESALPAVGLMRHVVVAETDSDGSESARSPFATGAPRSRISGSAAAYLSRWNISSRASGTATSGMGLPSPDRPRRSGVPRRADQGAGANLVLGQMIWQYARRGGTPFPCVSSRATSFRSFKAA